MSVAEPAPRLTEGGSRRLILDTAARLLRSGGYHQTTLREIAEAVDAPAEGLWMFGYLDLRKAAYVVLGVAIVFGASEIVSTLTGGS